MDIAEPFDIPETVIVDTATGLSINVPLSRQVPSVWMASHQEDYERILKARKAGGITIDDGFPEPDEEEEPVDTTPVPRRPSPTRKRIKDRT